MLCVDNVGYSLYQADDLLEIYQNNALIFTHNNISYISILGDDFSWKKTYLYFGVYNITPSNLKQLLFTFEQKYYNGYIRHNKMIQFKELQQYKQIITAKSMNIRVVYLSPYSMFKSIQFTNSELLNVEMISAWILEHKYALRFINNEPSARVYNFFNYVLYLLSRKSLDSVSQNVSKTLFNCESLSQHLCIDLTDNRPISKRGVNYLSLARFDQRKKYIRSEKNKILVQIDYKSSYLQILYNILGLKIPQGDIYQQLGQILGSQNETRADLKGLVFKILFSGALKKASKRPIFKDIYNFSLYLTQYYAQHGFLNALVSDKKIYIDMDKNFQGKLLNRFIMNLQFELYIGVIFNLLQFKTDKIKPIVFIYDSIIMQVDPDYYLDNTQYIERIITLNGKLRIETKIGTDMYSMQKI